MLDKQSNDTRKRMRQTDAMKQTKSFISRSVATPVALRRLGVLGPIHSGSRALGSNTLR